MNVQVPYMPINKKFTRVQHPLIELYNTNSQGKGLKPHASDERKLEGREGKTCTRHPTSRVRSAMTGS